MDSMLIVDKISFSYCRESFSLNDISFSVSRGELFGIIGPNGSGKTTLLKLLTGYLSPQKGSVSIFGKNIREMSIRERAKVFSVVPQTINTFFNFRVREIVALGRLPYRGDTDPLRDEKIIIEAMDKTHVLHLAERRFFSLSGGEKQRVLIAKSFAQKPRILLLDEFTSHLDIFHQKRIIDILLEEKRKNSLTVIATFHDINLASILSDNIIILKDGKMLSKGAPSEIITETTMKDTYAVKPIISPHPKYKVPQVFYP